MNDPNCGSDAVSLTLLPSQAQELLDVLERLAEGDDCEAGGSQLKVASEALDDALTVGIWLRDYVKLDLDGQDLTELVETITRLIETCTEEDCFGCGPFDRESLVALRSTLEQARRPAKALTA